MIVSKLDASQVQKLSYDEENKALRNINVGGTLVPEVHNKMELTYDGSGNIATVTYYQDLTQVALLTLGYDGSNRLISVTRT